MSNLKRTFAKIWCCSYIAVLIMVMGQGCGGGFEASPEYMSLSSDQSSTENQNPSEGPVSNPEEPEPEPNPVPSPVPTPMPDPGSPQPSPPPTQVGEVVLLETEASSVAGSSYHIRLGATGGSSTCMARVPTEYQNVVKINQSSINIADKGVGVFGYQISDMLFYRDPVDVLVGVECNGLKKGTFTIRALPKALATAFGTHHACAIDEAGSTYCWGRGWEGQVGDSRKQNHSVPYLVSTTLKFQIIRAGTQTTCGLTRSGQVFCWGQNSDAVSGTNDLEARTGPVTAVSGLPANIKVKDIGLSNSFNLFEAHVRLNQTPNHACALLANGEVWCWGDNRLAQLGQPASVTQSTQALRVPGVSDAQQLSVGGAHTCIIKKSDKKIYCWGDNHVKQLGPNALNSTSSSPVLIPGHAAARMVSSGGAFSCLIEAGTERVKCWGRNGHSELGIGSSTTSEAAPTDIRGLTNVASVTSGNMHACAITRDKLLYCWGDNYSGQLANGTQGGGRGYNQPTRISSLPERVDALSLGTFSTCALLESERMKCWGHGYFGEIGNNSQGANILLPAEVTNFRYR